MKLVPLLSDYLKAAFSGIWVVTHENDEVEREIVEHAHRHPAEWTVYAWDSALGFRQFRGNEPAKDADPVSALRSVHGLDRGGIAGKRILLLPNFHKYLGNMEVMQQVIASIRRGKIDYTAIIVTAPHGTLPPELEKLFVVLEHQLPDREQIAGILRSLDPDISFTTATQAAVDAAVGLTRYEAEGAFALSLARHGDVRSETVWELKCQSIGKTNLLTVHKSTEGFDSLGGLASLKNFCAKILRSPRKDVRPRGILSLGIPGCCKSQFAKALGKEVDRPTLILDAGSLMGSLVGQTEQNIRHALKIADAMSPCVLMVDEIEKALGGVGSQGDSGVSTRMFGTLLTWLSDHTSDVFFIATANDISKLPPEFTRAERFDGIFFVDLPRSEEKDLIWTMYRHMYQIPAGYARPDDTNWTGAEIRSCCRLAALTEETLTQSANNVVPVVATAAEQVDALRRWANGRCLDAASPGMYAFGQAKGGQRNVQKAERN